ncbi:hypothetical protein CHL67_07350 [Prosthecochloris sp. GSB1]|nr:hypothetical protein CHL67_07350 [Prosthecochloris sp. GSB1]
MNEGLLLNDLFSKFAQVGPLADILNTARWLGKNDVPRLVSHMRVALGTDTAGLTVNPGGRGAFVFGVTAIKAEALGWICSSFSG